MVSAAPGIGLAFAATGQPNASYQTFTYVGAGVTTRTWTVTAPQTPGSYEFRLFPDNTYTRAATSAPVLINAAQSPVPTIASVAAGKCAGREPGVHVHRQRDRLRRCERRPLEWRSPCDDVRQQHAVAGVDWRRRHRVGRPVHRHGHALQRLAVECRTRSTFTATAPPC